MITISVPIGFALTMTAPADSNGYYVPVGNPGDAVGVPVTLSAGVPVVLGPFNVLASYQMAANNGEIVYSLALSGELTAVDDAAIALLAPKASPTFSGKALFARAVGTEASNAVTISAQAGVITTSALTTAAAGSYVITLTNTLIAATSIVLLQGMGGTNTVADFTMKVVPGSGSAVITIYNADLLNALNGTLIIGFMVI